MCDDRNNLSRRKFLGSALTLGAGAFLTNPFRAIAEGIADSIIEKAVAETTGTQISRNYVNIFITGGPIRYQFDQWLKINSAEPDLLKLPSGIYNPMTCDSFTFGAAGAVTATKTNFKYGDFLVPHIFSQQVFNSMGQSRPVSDLLKNMLVVRGFGSGLDGHVFNSLKQTAPIGGVSTLAGLAAEHQSTTFNSVQWPSRGGYGRYIAINRAQAKINSATPLATLMNGFAVPKNPAAYNMKVAAEDAMAQAQQRLKDYSRAGNKASPLVAQNLTNAAALLKKGVGEIATYWDTAVARYKKAIDDSIQTTNIPGISSQEIISNQTGLWAIGNPAGVMVGNSYDARKLITNATITNLAESLALAEYLLKQGYAASIEVRADQLQKINLTDSTGVTNTSYVLPTDMHETGANSVIILMNAYYRGLTAGLLEFRDQLGPALWANTVVQLQGDFSRSARTSGTGSDHGFDQMVTSAFTGAFTNGPIVVGNIRQAGYNSYYNGTQGIAAPISGYNQQGNPTAAMAASTVAALLGIDKNPYANTAAPLVNLSGGVLRALFPPKIVA